MTKERNHAVLIGINDYAKQTGLRGCVNDVNDVSDHLTKANAVDAKNVVKLTDANATKAAILKTIKDMVNKLKDGDRGWVHFSCHGVRMPTTDTDEPDGLDEVLCPHEFDWSAGTSIADHELAKILANVVAGAHITVTIDSCHSGDMSRDLKPAGSHLRTILPPALILAQITLGKRSLRGGFRMLRSISQVGFASACSPWQQAADAPFDNGRYNGAFSYYFLKEAVAYSQKTIANIVSSIESSLQAYDMTPVSEGAVGIPFASLTGRRSLSQLPLSQTTLVRAATTVFEQQFSAIVLGQRFSVNVLIATSNGALDAYLTLSGFGIFLSVPPIRVDGNMTIPIPINVFGLQLIFRVTDYAFESQAIRFNIALDVTTPILFIPVVKIGQMTVQIPTSAFTRDLSLSVVPSSAAELVALLNLQDLGKEKQLPYRTGGLSKRGPHGFKKRSIVAKVLEIKTLHCIGAEAIFGDWIDIWFAGERLFHEPVNTNGTYSNAGPAIAIPEGGADLIVKQYYSGQASEDVLVKWISPEEPPQVSTLRINPRDDGDPGGEYVFSIEINNRNIN
jgi:metacaspase-1